MILYDNMYDRKQRYKVDRKVSFLFASEISECKADCIFISGVQTILFLFISVNEYLE